MKGIRLRHLSFEGSGKPGVLVTFGPGLNVIYGASDTGKSFVVDAIDFMLGGGRPLRDFGERAGYDRVFLGVESLEGPQFTLQRSTQGGGFVLYHGLFSQTPPPETTSSILVDHHNEKRTDNVSVFLLELCGLERRRVRQNRHNKTNSLSFRNVARLAIVDDTEIIRRESPLFDGNPSTNTTNKSTFRLLLTGVDDSALVETAPTTVEAITKDAQLDLLDEIIERDRKRLRFLTKDPSDIDDQLARLDKTLVDRSDKLSATEGDYRRLSKRRLELRRALARASERRDEIASLLERFRLLDKHYRSDVARLKGLQEAGTLFDVMSKQPCPFCGSEPEHHRRQATSTVDVPAVVQAAGHEIVKIVTLRRDLGDTVASLRSEAVAVGGRLGRIEPELGQVSMLMDHDLGPQLSEARTSYKDIADKRARVSEAQFVRDSLSQAEKRRADLETSLRSDKDVSSEGAALSAGVAEAFARCVETLLKEWHFPDGERVFFDRASSDLVIGGKPRGARGAGLRAITHAAFTLGLLDYCRESDTPHPGFVVLDSPLLAYREPEGAEDDLRGTDLKDRFYQLLFGWPDDRQVIIVETTDPPKTMREDNRMTFFSKNPTSERYGLFPVASPSEEPSL